MIKDYYLDMGKKYLLVAIPVLIILVISSCQAQNSPEITQEEKYLPGILYIKFAENQNVLYEDDAKTIINSLENKNSDLSKSKKIEKLFSANPSQKNYNLKKQFGLDRWVKIEISKDLNVIEEAEKWSNLKEVEEAKPVIKTELTQTPNDPFLELQWQHNNNGINPPGQPDADMDTLEAWDIEKGEEIIIATTEYIQWDHEDLVNNIWQNLGEDIDGDGAVLEWSVDLGKYTFDSGDINGIDDDGNGYIDDFIGWNFLDNNNNPSSQSNGGCGNDPHGTATAGCALATTNNSIGVSGTCWNCKLIAISARSQFVDEQGMEYAIDNGARVISRSYISDPSNDLVDYGEALGVVFLSSAGNDHSPEVNEACKNEKVICVSSTDTYDKLTYFTNYGPEVDVGAPGVYVYTTTCKNTYTSFGGTSASTPLVAGVVALIKSKNPELTTKEVISILQSSTDPFQTPENYAGNGRVNSQKALQLTQNSLNFGSFPISIINSEDSKLHNGELVIRGDAISQDFSYYEIWYAKGLYSEKKELISRNTVEVENGILATIRKPLPSLINSTITLKVYDTNGQVASDTFKIEDTQIILSQEFKNYGVNENQNNEYDKLVVEAPVYISEEGDYNLLAGLGTQDGFQVIDQIYEEIHLNEGMNYIKLEFDGYKIFHTNQNGPYLLNSLMIFQGIDVIDSLNDPYYTDSYLYTQFENIVYFDSLFNFISGDPNEPHILRYLEVDNSIIEDYFNWGFNSIEAPMEEGADVTIAIHEILDTEGNINFFGTKFKNSIYQPNLDIVSYYKKYSPEEFKQGKLRFYSLFVNQPNWEFDNSSTEIRVVYSEFEGNRNYDWRIFSCSDFDFSNLRCTGQWKKLTSTKTISVENNHVQLSINSTAEFAEAYALGYEIGKPSTLPNIATAISN